MRDAHRMPNPVGVFGAVCGCRADATCVGRCYAAVMRHGMALTVLHITGSYATRVESSDSIKLLPSLSGGACDGALPPVPTDGSSPLLGPSVLCDRRPVAPIVPVLATSGRASPG